LVQLRLSLLEFLSLFTRRSRVGYIDLLDRSLRGQLLSLILLNGKRFGASSCVLGIKKQVIYKKICSIY
jgi:hypothetical protein